LGEILPIYKSDKGILFTIYKEDLKKIHNPLKMNKGFEKMLHHRRITDGK
jgi:hypothetical protein